MTEPIRIDPDTVAAYLIGDLRSEATRNPQAFLDTLLRDFDGDAEHFAEIILVDEGDVPDEIRSVFHVEDDSLDEVLFSALRDSRTFDLLVEAIHQLEQLITP